MTTVLTKLVLIFSLLTLGTSIKAWSNGDLPTVVIFFSMDANLPAYNGFLKGLTNELSSTELQPYNTLVEYMDIGRFSDSIYLSDMVQRFNEKYQPVDIDFIITFGPNTLPLLDKLGLDQLRTSNVINIDIEHNIQVVLDSPDINKDRILNIAVKADYQRSLKAAFDLFPEFDDVYFISGASPADNYFSELLHRAAVDFTQSHRFHYCTNTTLDSTVAFVKRIPENSIVFVSSYIEDSNRIPFTSTMICRIVSTQSNAPTFTLTDDFIEGNAVGGYIYSFEDVGRYTKSAIKQVIKGERLTDIAVDEYSFSNYMYDWNALVRFGVEDSPAIPPGSELYNKNESFVTRYGWYLVAGLVFVIAQTYLIFLLFRLYRKQAFVATQREENEMLYRQMVREDRHTRMSALAASLSHELNQPLTAILYNAQAAQRFLANDRLTDKLASEILSNIIEDDKRAAGLISSLRGLMKLEVREHEQVDLNSVILDTLNLFHAETVAQHIEVSCRPAKEQVNVFGDRVQLQQVILNLLINAENAMASNGQKPKTIDIDLQRVDNFCVVTILDSGPGIEDSLKDTIFKPFVTSTSSGMGIGLAISKSIIESHEGRISVKNHPQGGAQFSIKLPLYHEGT